LRFNISLIENGSYHDNITIKEQFLFYDGNQLTQECSLFHIDFYNDSLGHDDVDNGFSLGLLLFLHH
jgi:hypothetical protein